jgi:hypothetical protein
MTDPGVSAWRPGERVRLGVESVSNPRFNSGTSTSSRGRGTFVTLIVFIASFLFLAALADRDGLEGDDLNSIVPMLNLGAALDGLIAIYRYDWQPLSYQLGALVAEITHRTWPIFLLAGLAMAAGIAIQYRILSHRLGVPVLIFLCIIMLSPELVYTGLYFNSTALGYPFAAAALALALAAPGSMRSVLIGLFLGVAFMFRLEFVLMAPAVLLLLWFHAGSAIFSVIAGAVLGAIGLGVLVTGFIDLDNVLEIYRFASTEIAEKSGTGGWNAHAKMFVASTLLSPLGFIYYGLGSAWLLWVSSRKARKQGLLVLLSLIPAFLPLQDLLSVKYMIPSYVFLPLLGGLIWSRLRDRLGTRIRPFNYALVFVTAFLLVASVDVDNQRPFVKLSFWPSRQISTHDGPRSWGAYLPQMMHIGLLPAVDSQRGPMREAGEQLADAIASGNAPIVAFVGTDGAFGPGAVGWRHAIIALVDRGFRAEVVGKELMVIRSGDRQLWLSTSVEGLPQEVVGNSATLVLDESDPQLAERIAALDG